MKKKILLIFITLFCVICCAFGLTACGDNIGNNQGTEQPDDKPKGEYTVTYDANGGKFADGETTLTQKVKDGETLTAPSSPTSTAAVFSGWATEKNGTTLWEFATDKVTENITLYAVWEEQSATVISVDGASIDDKKMTVFMLVDKDTQSVSLSNKVVCSSESVWKLYYDKLGQTEIPTKIAASKFGELENGNNVFYIVVTSSNGSHVNVYELNIHRSYNATVSYYDNKDNLIETDTAYSGYEYEVNYLPTIDGYAFNFWKDGNGNEVEKITLYEPLKLYADCTAKTYAVTLDSNGGADITGNGNATYDEGFTLPTAARTGYTFTGWYYDGMQITDESGNSLKNWTFTDGKTFTAGWQISRYYVTATVNDENAGIVMVYAYDGSPAFEGKYDYNSKVTIEVMTNAGYIFLGIFDEAGNKVNEDNELSYTTTLGADDESYTAKWSLDERLSDFIFTSTTNTLTITGVKDNSITEVVLPDGVTSIKENAFGNCDNLTSVTIPDSVTSIGSNAFKGCPIQTAKIPALGSYYVNNGNLQTVEITSGNTVSDSAFKDCTNLTNVTICDSVIYIRSHAFENCKSLTEINFSDRLTTIGNDAFRGCANLTSITLPDGVYSIDNNAFAVCESLVSITIPKSVTTIKGSPFWGCRLSLVIYCEAANAPTGWSSDWNQYWFVSRLPIVWSCKTNDVANNGYIYATVGGLAYRIKDGAAMVSEQSISISAAVISESIGYKGNDYKVTGIYTGAFGGCSNLTSVTIPDSVTFIGSDAFGDCGNLTEITLPNKLTTIGNYAFRDCDNLTSITIPESVTFIGSDAFQYCIKLTIYCEAESEPNLWNTDWNSGECPVVWDCKING